MKKSATVVVLAGMLLMSGAGYVFGGTNQSQVSNPSVIVGPKLIKKFEQWIQRKKQEAAKFQLGDLVLYRSQIAKEIKKTHPDFTKVTNLGMYSHNKLIDIREQSVTVSHYLLEVKDDKSISYYEIEKEDESIEMEFGKYGISSSITIDPISKEQAENIKQSLK